MSTGILLITHESVAEALKHAAEYVLGGPQPGLGVLPVNSDRAGADLCADVRASLSRIDEGDGVLMLTDLVGATPANLASGFSSPRACLVTGVNLPMLIRALNYRHLDPADLARKALDGGRDGIMELQPASDK